MSEESVGWIVSGVLSEEFNGWYLPAREHLPESARSARELPSCGLAPKEKT